MFFVSPGVFTRERDISNIIPNIATTTAAIVGYSTRGEKDALRLITTPQQFLEEYGEPNAVNGYFHHSALIFLEQGKTLYAKRVCQNALYGGVNIIKSGGIGSNSGIAVGVSIPAVQEISSEDVLLSIFGKDPGTWNNKIGVTITDIDAVENTFNINVFEKDVDGNDIRVESWTVSRQVKVDGFGKQLYLESRINGRSQYIVVKNNTDEADTVLPTAQSEVLMLEEGSNGTSWTAMPSSAFVNGWNDFLNPDDVDVRILINGGQTATEVQLAMKSVAESRKDCIAILDIPYDELGSVSEMRDWRRDSQHNFNSSYTALYSPWVTWYDTFNDMIVNIPPSGFVASMIAYTDYIAEPWYAPAGMNRGQLNALGLTNIFTQGERDILYQSQINPLQTWRGEGHVIWGQKTQQVKASALDRVNVRRLLIILQKAISAQLRYFVFEPNSELTRFRVTSMCEEYLNTLSAKGAFQTELGDRGFRVLCNETNNTPEVIDRNELHVDIFVKASRAAEYIQLQTIITTTGASFEELISKGVMF
jgi:uncharacterized protein